MNLKQEELVKALRCCNTEEFGCKDCALHREFPSGICGCGGEPCDIAADQIERDQKEIADLKAKVEQYRALIPSWVIPMTPKEDNHEN